MSTELSIQKQIEQPQAVEKFAKIFSGIHKVDEDTAKQMYEVEKFQFLKEVQEKGLQDVTPMSAMGCFLDVVSNGLSFGSTAKHVYMMSRNVKVKTQAGEAWEKRMVFSTAPDGKIFQAQRAGSIEYVTKPVIVYEGDDFAVGTNEQGEQIIRHSIKFPRASNKIVAGYVYVIFKGGKREPYWMDVGEIERLKGYSAKQNKDRGANALYTSNNGQIDPGFFGAKLINFALKNVRKMGTASPNEVEDEEMPQIADGAQYQPTMLVTPAQELANTPPAQASHTNDDEDLFN